MTAEGERETVETFWPPPRGAFVAWYWRAAVLFVAPIAAFQLLTRGSRAILVSTVFGFAPARWYQSLVPTPEEVPLLIGMAVLIVTFPALLAWRIGRLARRGPGLASLEPSERLLASCAVTFVDTASRPGFLLVTDRRLVRLEVAGGTLREGTLAHREDVVTLDWTARRELGNPLLRPLLRFVGRDHGVTLTTRDGKTFAWNASRLFLEPSFAWLKAQGFATGFRNEPDGGAPALATPALVERRVPVEGRRRAVRLLVAGIALTLCLLAMANVQALTELYVHRVLRQPRLVNVKLAGPLPTLARTDARPAAPERALATLWVDNYAWKGGDPRAIGIRKLTLVRRADAVQLVGDDGWEPVGDPAESDAALVEKATRRIEGRAR